MPLFRNLNDAIGAELFAQVIAASLPIFIAIENNDADLLKMQLGSDAQKDENPDGGKGAKKSGGRKSSGGGRKASGGGGGGRSGGSSRNAAGAATGAGSSSGGPITVVSVGGDNNKIQTLHIPAGQTAGKEIAPQATAANAAASAPVANTARPLPAQTAARANRTPNAAPIAQSASGANRQQPADWQTNLLEAVRGIAKDLAKFLALRDTGKVHQETEAPQIAAPSISPVIEAPAVNVPAQTPLEMPQIAAPAFSPVIESPSVNVPQATPLEIPQLAAPNFSPVIELPAVNLPRAESLGQSVADSLAVLSPAINANSLQKAVSGMAATASDIALPRAPEMLREKSAKRRESENGGLDLAFPEAPSNALTIELNQNFDIMSGDPAAFRKVMESLKPDFERLVRMALEKMQSDRRRTAYAQ